MNKYVLNGNTGKLHRETCPRLYLPSMTKFSAEMLMESELPEILPRYGKKVECCKVCFNILDRNISTIVDNYNYDRKKHRKL